MYVCVLEWERDRERERERESLCVYSLYIVCNRKKRDIYKDVMVFRYIDRQIDRHIYGQMDRYTEKNKTMEKERDNEN